MSEKPKKASSLNSRIRRAAMNVIMICLALIVVVSGWKVFTIVRGYQADRSAYDEVTKVAQPTGFTGDIDFEALRKINPDVIGWLYYKDMRIDYPVVQGPDNDQYLSMLFDRSWGGCGTLFADCVTVAPFKQFNTIVYGHHMKDGSMFAQLKKLVDPKFCEEHPQLELITPEGKYHLLIWAFLNQPSDSGIYMTNFTDVEQCEEHIELARSLADYTTDVEVTPEDTLVELSTCAYEFEEARYIVICKMVPWEN